MLWVLSYWTAFFRQKAVFLIPVMRSRSKGKRWSYPYARREGVHGTRGRAPLILDLRSRWRSLSASRPSHFTREKGPWYPLWGRLLGYRAGMDVSEERISCPCWDLSRSQWPRGLRRRSATARLLELWVWIPPGARMSVFCERCVFVG